MLLASVLPLIDSGLVNVLLRTQSAAALVNLGSREQPDWVVRALIQRPLSGMGDDQLELTVMSSAAMVAKSVADLLGRPAPGAEWRSIAVARTIDGPSFVIFLLVVLADIVVAL